MRKNAAASILANGVLPGSYVGFLLICEADLPKVIQMGPHVTRFRPGSMGL